MRPDVASDAELERRISSMIASRGNGIHASVLRREENPYSSTFPSEVVTCALGNHEQRQFFCKYMRPDIKRSDSARRELFVYENILSSTALPQLCYYGSWKTDRGGVCLVMDYLSDGLRVSKVSRLESAMEKAAAWIGAFHRLAGSDISSETIRELDPYDAAHFFDRMNRMKKVHHGLPKNYSWLTKIYESYDFIVDTLLRAPQVVIHGEYCPANILFSAQAKSVYPVDWETASIGAGVIDLAMLVENWPKALSKSCQNAYLMALQSKESKEVFQEQLAAASAYLTVHWLGYPTSSKHLRASLEAKGHWRLDNLRIAGEQLNLI